MDRAKAAVYLVGLFGLATIGEALGLASMSGPKPQLSVFFGGGILLSGVAVQTLYQQRYEEFAVFRDRALVFWAVALGVIGYVVVISLQFV